MEAAGAPVDSVNGAMDRSAWPANRLFRVHEFAEAAAILLMQSIGLDPARFGAHSLRIGGATAALAAGVPPSMIRIIGALVVRRLRDLL